MSKVEFLNKISEVIKERKEADPSESYTAELFQDGLSKISQKVGEEAVETVVAALSETNERLISESADLIFHLLILLDAKGVSLDEVMDELERRNKQWISKI